MSMLSLAVAALLSPMSPQEPVAPRAPAAQPESPAQSVPTALPLSVLAAPSAPRDLAALLAEAPASVQRMLAAAAEHRLQILVGEPELLADGRLVLRRSQLGDARRYFYPASTVKLGAAIAALLELQRLAQTSGAPFDLDAEWTFARRFASDGVMPPPVTIRRDLRRMLLVSDNAAFNHCFELVGPRGLNETLWAAGFASARIWHRLSEPHPLAENRQTRAVTLRQGDAVRELPARDEAIALDNGAFADLEIGTAHATGGGVEAKPMSFAEKNAIALVDLQDLLAAVVRPEIDTGKRGFPQLGLGARTFVVQTMGTLPRESTDPVYPAADFPDDLCKFVLPGVRRVVPAQHLRVFDKSGQAYGFTIENAYIEDQRSGRGFFLAAVLYTNPNGVIGDDDYGYRELALPFFADLGEVVARAVFAGG